ncbi:hypothetical protein AruPA_16235 [Acidiphilium sp. PA]|uniref:hypothetical protein n=1 Tax=Acidiphilium sp. PA TaxID=2871705 RepID=UPI00224461DF|nr:hypothetical protein [Acidiphilium sp. PA]MCW8308586.1 hypothetical protein [Acidiphilium sp. PA]
MEKIHLTRMTEGLRVLREIQQADKPFSLGLWLSQLIDAEWEGEPELDSGNPSHECGTVGCAVGWMTQDPWHQKQGLRMGILEDHGMPVPFYRNLSTGEITTGWDAIGKYFGISRDEADHLFYYDEDDVTSRRISRTISDVIERFDQFHQKYQAEYDRKEAVLENDIPF